MKVLNLLMAAALLMPGTMFSRDWVDRNGLVIEATVYQMSSRSVGLRLKSGQVVEVEKSKLSKRDQDYLQLMEAHKETSQRLRLKVFQSMRNGALCTVYKTRVVTKRRKVPSHYSKLQQKQYYTYENYQEVENIKVYDLAYIEGLTTVVDDDILDIIAWGDGSYSYATVDKAEKTVPKFSLNPVISARPVQQFGQ